MVWVRRKPMQKCLARPSGHLHTYPPHYCWETEDFDHWSYNRCGYFVFQSLVRLVSGNILEKRKVRLCGPNWRAGVWLASGVWRLPSEFIDMDDGPSMVYRLIFWSRLNVKSEGSMQPPWWWNCTSGLIAEPGELRLNSPLLFEKVSWLCNLGEFMTLSSRG